MQNCAECEFIHYHKHAKPILTEKYQKLYDNLIDIINGSEEIIQNNASAVKISRDEKLGT